jgi:inner membrane protein
MSIWYHISEMFILGHAGITLGAAVLLNIAFSKVDSHIVKQYDVEGPADNSVSVNTRSLVFISKAPRLMSLAKQIDIRLLLVGSLLPDYVDKPIYLLGIDNGSGRTYCHTLLFLVLIIIAGLYIYKRHAKVWLLVISFGTLTHLILDQMWLTPRTLLWPVYGFRFDRGDVSGWPPCIGELIGGVILAWFVWVLIRNSKVYAFLKNGRVL